MNYLPRALRLGNHGILPTALQWSPSQLSSPISFRSLIQAAAISTRPSPATPRHTLRSSAKDNNNNNKTQRSFSRPPVPPPAKTEEELIKLNYLVRRTSHLGLPVYRRWKSGNTREIVLVKRIDGDRRKLLEDLVEGVGIARDDIRINSVTQHIELKGNYFGKTKDWLLEKGF